MKRIDFSHIGGFPLEQDTLNFMQDGYADMFAAIAAMFGDKRILSGVQVQGGNVTPGYITYEGTVIPFTGGVLAPQVVISDTTQDALFEDGNSHAVYKTRTATVGNVGAFPFTDLRRANIGLPLGIPQMFVGPVANIPADWTLCDGSMKLIAEFPDLFAAISNIYGGDGITEFQLPDMRSLFVAGYNPADADFNFIGKKAGVKEVTLLESNLPKHKPKGGVAPNGNNPGNLLYTRGGISIGTWEGNQIGGDVPFKILPSYFTLAYILKLK